MMNRNSVFLNGIVIAIGLLASFGAQANFGIDVSCESGSLRMQNVRSTGFTLSDWDADTGTLKLDVLAFPSLQQKLSMKIAMGSTGATCVGTAPKGLSMACVNKIETGTISKTSELNLDLETIEFALVGNPANSPRVEVRLGGSDVTRMEQFVSVGAAFCIVSGK